MTTTESSEINFRTGERRPSLEIVKFGDVGTFNAYDQPEMLFRHTNIETKDIFESTNFKRIWAMGKETVLFKSEEKKSIVQVTGFLRELADKLDSNKVAFIQGKQVVKVKVPSTVELEIKVEKETGKRKTKKKIELEIEWIVGEKSGKGSDTVKLG